jgi:hypothetical protein
MERILDRAFTKVHGSVSAVQSTGDLNKAAASKGPDPASFERPADGEGETPQQAIQRILHCWKHKEYFKWVDVSVNGKDSRGQPTTAKQHLDARRRSDCPLHIECMAR